MLNVFKVSENKYRVVFGGNNFYEFLDVARVYLKYDPSSKSWNGNRVAVSSFLNEAGRIENITLPDDLKKELEGAQEFKTYDIPVRFDLLTLPPIKGKPPFENYQMEDIEKVSRQNRSLLALEMGLGKTYIAISAYANKKANGIVDRLLILCPSEARFTWKHELIRFLNIKESEIYIASVKDREPFESNCEFIIIPYSTLVMLEKEENDSKGRIKKSYLNEKISKWKGNYNRMLIIDESHFIKNIKSKRTNIINLIKNNFEERILMSGTPYPKGFEELYAQIKVLDESIIPYDYNTFIRDIAYTYDIGYTPIIKTDRNNKKMYVQKKLDEFFKKISPIYIRRYAKDVLELPDLIIKKTYVEMSDAHRELYKYFSLGVLSSMQEEFGGITADALIKRFGLIQLILDNPCILKENQGEYLKPCYDKIHPYLKNWKFEDNAKVEIMDNLVEEYIEEENKIIIWSGHPLTIKQIADRYKKYNAVYIDGSIKDDERFSILEKFKKDENCHILVASYYVMSTSQTINEACRNIYFDRSYDLTYWLQSQKRTHRIGQDKTVKVDVLLFEKTLDMRLDAVLDERAGMNNDIRKYVAFTDDQLKKIFNGDLL